MPNYPFRAEADIVYQEIVSAVDLAAAVQKMECQLGKTLLPISERDPPSSAMHVMSIGDGSIGQSQTTKFEGVFQVIDRQSFWAD